VIRSIADFGLRIADPLRIGRPVIPGPPIADPCGFARADARIAALIADCGAPRLIAD